MNPPPMHLTAHDRLRSQGVAIARWLLACALLCFLMLVIGGLTRLTGSGLSIVEWRPVTGAVPPLDLRDWAVLFEQYRQSPQFRIENAHMTLEGFRRIFWWEYIHRLMGRVTGLVFALPLLWFWRKGQLPAALRVRLPAIFALGAAQGVMGWLMVKSGLVDDPRVSPVRLALHLGLAFVLVGLLVRTALTVREGAAHAPKPPSALSRSADVLAATVFVMALSGALVAGNHAGLAFNTWPLMAGSLVPAGLFPIQPWYLGALLDVTTVQFDHRALALVLALAVPGFWIASLRAPIDRRSRRWCHLVMATFVAQFSLGVATLLLAVPIALASLHQANSMLFFVATLGAGHALRRSPTVELQDLAPPDAIAHHGEPDGGDSVEA
ncbi:MAG: heme A synthase [Myxococcaceae bacterium]|nr:MAG: heme A synthase [Myxococcaceae bacterium]